MKVIKRYNQYRRDLSIDMECEGCEATDSYHSAYDDRYFWDSVVPNFKCNSCGKTTRQLGAEVEQMPTRYAEGQQV
jgi:hypothetical protein